MKGLNNQTIGQTLNSALTTTKIEDKAGLASYMYFLALFDNPPTGGDDYQRFIKSFEFSRDERTGKFKTDEALLNLINDIDRAESPIPDDCKKIRITAGLYMRKSATQLPIAEEDIAARWIVNLGQPITLSMVGGNHSFRVFFDRLNYRFLGAVQQTNYSIKSPSGHFIRVPTIHTMLNDGRQDKNRLKMKKYRRITLTVDAIGSSVIEDEELRKMLEKTLKVRDNAIAGKESSKDLKEAADIAQKASERFTLETKGEEAVKDLNKKVEEMKEALEEVLEDRSEFSPTSSHSNAENEEITIPSDSTSTASEEKEFE